ncbi:MAG: hypothetical protein ACRDQ5_23930, partial [Sciscionella sp.]
QSKEFFEGHFASIFDRSTADGRILEAAGHRPLEFNTTLYNKLRDVLIDQLGQEQCDKLLNG